uniref:Uncharacterized protein n=1 Tax=Romanomermis culicivorax TaxID=13658 RepID=A0A915HL81_ROMCU
MEVECLITSSDQMMEKSVMGNCNSQENEPSKSKTTLKHEHKFQTSLGNCFMQKCTDFNRLFTDEQNYGQLFDKTYSYCSTLRKFIHFKANYPLLHILTEEEPASRGRMTKYEIKKKEKRNENRRGDEEWMKTSSYWMMTMK